MQAQIGATMKEDWNRRALENACWYVASDVKDDEEFTRSGEPDVDFALRGLDPQWLGKAHVLEFSCGAGRLPQFFLEEVRSEFRDWRDVDLEVTPVTDTTDHIWINAMK